VHAANRQVKGIGSQLLVIAMSIDANIGLLADEYDSVEGFCALRPYWNSLVELTQSVTVFSTWEWQTTWWKHYGAGSTLRIIAVRESDRVVGILPLYLRRIPVAPLLYAHELRLVGTGADTSPDYLGPLIDPARESAVAAVLAKQLLENGGEWDLLHLTDVCTGMFLDVLVGRLRAAGVDPDVRVCSSIQVVRLPSSWDEYLARMPGERRRRIGNLRRSALRKLGAQFQVAQTEAELPAVIDALICLHRKRWDSKGTDMGAFRSTAYKRFHREVIARCHQNGWIRLYRIEANRKIAAILYCYRYRGDILFFQTGFDPELEHFRLGQVLLGFAIESAIAEGAEVFDMLKGEYAYKSSWSNDVRRTFELLAYNASVRGRLALLRRKLGVLRSSLAWQRRREQDLLP
jgi:CelD/BcsL family acetyltransferase involved in cellulose biosynthesis